MPTKRTAIVITIGRAHVGAVEVRSTKGTAVPTGHALHQPIPRDVDPADPEALGRWLRSHLDHAGFSATDAVLCLERRDAITKPLTFERVLDPDADLPGLVRHELIRQLAFPAHDAAVDFVRRTNAHPTGDDTITVHAAAAPAPRLEHLHAVLRAAGLNHTRTTLTAEAITARAAAATPIEPNQTALLITPTPDGWECIVAQHNHPVSARWESIAYTNAINHTPADPDDDTALPLERNDAPPAHHDLTQALTAEARRAWMTHQLRPDAEPIDRIILIADRDAGIDQNAIAAALGKPIHTLTASDFIASSSATVPPPLLPLIAAAQDAADPQRAGQRIDLHNPRTPPDRAARTRKLALAAALLLLLVLGGIYTAGQRAAAQIDRDIERAQAERLEAANRRAAAVRDAARAEHLARFLATSVSPTEHILRVAELIPAPERARIAALSIDNEAGVDFDTSGRLRWYEHERWRASRLLSINLRATTASRPDADALRDAFVNSDYTADTAGTDGDTSRHPDFPHRIDLRLTRFDDDIAQPLLAATDDARTTQPDTEGPRAEASP